jgi:N-acetyltransferase 10
MIRPINTNDNAVELPDQIKKYAEADSEDSWASAYTVDFRKRLLNLLGFEFRHLPCSLALQLVNPSIKVSAQSGEDLQEDTSAINSIKKEDVERHISLFDLKRLESYAKNLVDFHLIMDLVPTLAKLYFSKQVLPRSAVTLSYTQSAILLGLGLQFKSVEDLQVDLNL